MSPIVLVHDRKMEAQSRVFYDKKVSQKMLCKFYKVMVRVNILYEMKCCLVKKSHYQKIKVIGEDTLS